MKKYQNDWGDHLRAPSNIRRLFPAGLPELDAVRFERLLITTPEEVVLGVRFFPLNLDDMKVWADKGFAAVDLRLSMSGATVLDLVGESLNEQPIGRVEIREQQTSFVVGARSIITINWKWLDANFVPEPQVQKMYNTIDRFETEIDS
jgi:hypothetical protein